MSKRTKTLKYSNAWNACSLLPHHCFQNWNSQFATGWFFFDHPRRTVQPIDEPNPQGDSPNPVQSCFCSGFFEPLFIFKE
ncbi:hypothetical protein, partial [Acidovorax sp. Root217]|uniref:hypothetical protein n=1 Tax=Acidovorax sp. Root217 TaxID=1736492 RepID=UPI001F3FCF81